MTRRRNRVCSCGKEMYYTSDKCKACALKDLAEKAKKQAPGRLFRVTPQGCCEYCHEKKEKCNGHKLIKILKPRRNTNIGRPPEKETFPGV